MLVASAFYEGYFTFCIRTGKIVRVPTRHTQEEVGDKLRVPTTHTQEEVGDKLRVPTTHTQEETYYKLTYYKLTYYKLYNVE